MISRKKFSLFAKCGSSTPGGARRRRGGEGGEAARRRGGLVPFYMCNAAASCSSCFLIRKMCLFDLSEIGDPILFSSGPGIPYLSKILLCGGKQLFKRLLTRKRMLKNHVWKNSHHLCNCRSAEVGAVHAP